MIDLVADLARRDVVAQLGSVTSGCALTVVSSSTGRASSTMNGAASVAEVATSS